MDHSALPPHVMCFPRDHQPQNASHHISPPRGCFVGWGRGDRSDQGDSLEIGVDTQKQPCALFQKYIRHYETTLLTMCS